MKMKEMCVLLTRIRLQSRHVGVKTASNQWMNMMRSALLCLAILISSALPAFAKERVYYVAAQDVIWDYAPSQDNQMMGREFSEDEQVFAAKSASTIGSTYKKTLYIEYTDASFNTVKERDSDWAHLGFLGPVFHAEVGDTIKVIFKNKSDRPYSIHPHGVFYEKSSEGARYNDGTSGNDLLDDAVQSGETYIYQWEVRERAGPGPKDPDSIAWLYHSHVSGIQDPSTGLIGAMIITRKGAADTLGRPRDVAREFINVFWVTDESLSWHADKNAEPLGQIEDTDAFEEGNLMHNINGYIYGNIPDLRLKEGEKSRWYLFGFGSEVDLHTPHWHGNTVLWDGRRADTIDLLPASHKIVDMTPDAPGTWMYHCHVNDHISAGMTALYHVLPANE